MNITYTTPHAKDQLESLRNAEEQADHLAEHLYALRETFPEGSPMNRQLFRQSMKMLKQAEELRAIGDGLADSTIKTGARRSGQSWSN